MISIYRNRWVLTRRKWFEYHVCKSIPYVDYGDTFAVKTNIIAIMDIPDVPTTILMVKSVSIKTHGILHEMSEKVYIMATGNRINSLRDVVTWISSIILDIPRSWESSRWSDMDIHVRSMVIMDVIHVQVNMICAS